MICRDPPPFSFHMSQLQLHNGNIMSTTLKEIENEERKLRNRMIEIDVEIKNHPKKVPFTMALELDRILRGQG